MAETAILDFWEADVAATDVSIVLPDGCRDLIYCIPASGKPHWFLSNLDLTARHVQFRDSRRLHGVRLKPGTILTDNLSVENLNQDRIELDRGIQRIGNSALIESSVEESLTALRQERTVGEAAIALGLSMRTLQRKVTSQTGQAPRFWNRLSRVRRAARHLIAHQHILSCVLECGYADQPHLNREFKTWFGVSPRTFLLDDERCSRILDSGY